MGTSCHCIRLPILALGVIQGAGASVVQARPRPISKAPVNATTRPQGTVFLLRARQAPARPVPKRTAPAHVPAYLEILRARGRAKGSVSLGTTSRGRILRAARLPLKGKHHAVMPRWRARATQYGTDELVSLLLHGARRVAKRHPGAMMMVGNLSFQRGGGLPWSHSHNAGRDADIAFYLRRRGKPVRATGLFRIDDRLRSIHPGGYRFDVARNWTLVKALLSHPTVRAQWLFLANPLKEALLKHARSLREPEALLARAEKILHQPGDSRPHDDHLHVRIYCTRQDRLEGCVDRAPFWPGVKTYADALEARIRSLLRGLRDPDPTVRLGIIAFLRRLNAAQGAPEVARYGLRDSDARVRRAALAALAHWRRDDVTVIAELARMIRRPGGGVARGDPRFERSKLGAQRRISDPGRTGAQLRLAYGVLAKLASPRAVGLLRRALTSQRSVLPARRGQRAIPEVLLAARTARTIMDLRLVPPLISALDHPGGAVRRQAAETLRRITNHSYRVRWSRRMSPKTRRLRSRRWESWWAVHQRQGREALVSRGFRRANRRLRDLRTRAAQRLLVTYTRRDDHLGFNAHQTLRRLSGRRVVDTRIGAAARHRIWRRWFRKRWGRPR